MEKNDLKGLTSRGQYLIFLLTWVSLEHGSSLGTDCTVILRCCKPKLDKKCRSYVTLKNQTNLNLQFASFFRGLKRGLFDQIRCSQWPQGMVLDGLKGFQSKKSKSMTFNYKSVLRYLILPHLIPTLVMIEYKLPSFAFIHTKPQPNTWH